MLSGFDAEKSSSYMFIRLIQLIGINERYKHRFRKNVSSSISCHAFNVSIKSNNIHRSSLQLVFPHPEVYHEELYQISYTITFRFMQHIPRIKNF